ncbi:hypothetical protein DID88_006395 [Monilinia fructigena]|uniref:Uncharacterized protein n=1 Tax=Monilinia fructigena TaxID=38457 RepID=A0A395IEQ3_9HELO|nr:hypothetical protein DID88_006395 [Monilinia fructigena]
MRREWDSEGEEAMDRWDSNLDITNLTLDYEAGVTPQLVVEAIYDRIEAYKEVQPSLWIHLESIDNVMSAADELYRRWPEKSVAALESSGGQRVELDWTPFASANELLYGGTFVLERLTTLPEGWFDNNKELLHPIIRSVFEGALARHSTAIDVFNDLHEQAKYKRMVEDILTIDNEDGALTVMVVPTPPLSPHY